MSRIAAKFLDDFFEQEVPSGSVNGSNTVFTLSATPHSIKAVGVYVNGIRRRLTTDYSVSGSTVTFTFAPETDSDVYVEYIKK
jgi:hypothetical protein